MFPEQLRQAKDSRIPVLLPIGTIEYHGPHCVYGCDGLIAQGLAGQLEKKHSLVMLPTFWYGASSYAVGGPEKGTIDVSFDALKKTFSDMFYSMLEGGFRNIVALIHHQYEQESYADLLSRHFQNELCIRYLRRLRLPAGISGRPEGSSKDARQD